MKIAKCDWHIYLLVCLLPFWPAINFINKNKFEPNFDIAWLIFYLCVVLFLLLAIYAICTIYVSKELGLKILILLSSLLCFFQYYYDFKALVFENDRIGAALIIFLICSLGIGVLSWFAGKNKKIASGIGAFAATVFFLALLPVLNESGDILIDLNRLPFHLVDKGINKVDEEAGGKNKSNAPNVYYFVFDGYLRSDRLKEYFGYDNEPFLIDLESRGFKIARESRSNFPTTVYSLNYALNPSLALRSPIDLPEKLRKLDTYCGNRESEVAKTFHSRGYDVTMMFHTGDIGTACKPNCITTRPKITFSQIQYLKNTPVYDVVKKYYPEILWSWLSTVPNDNRYALKNLPMKIKHPFFLFSHALMPHPPYAVSSDCSMNKSGVVDFEMEYDKDWDYLRERYLEQVSCANRQMVEIADILDEVAPSAIVLFVSDHGWKYNHALKKFTEKEKIYKAQLTMRLSNFMAARAPKKCQSYFDKDMSLVNSFPFVFACLDGKQPEYFNSQSYVIKNSSIMDVTEIVME
jgi:hypothetical protein